MELTRIIHPIGQGGFYTETLRDGNEEVNVVYDCGGFYKLKQSKQQMINYLQTSYGSKDIDAVFISHFDYDHINGLEYLLDPKNKYNVKYLFLPQLEEYEIIEVLASNLSKVSILQDKRFYDFIIKLIDGDYSLSQSLQIVFVSRYNNNTITNGIDINSLSAGIIPTGTNICFFDKWEYIPYNPPKISKTVNGETFYECFKREIGDFSPKEFPNKIQGKVNQCKKIYKDFFGKHNSYSMTLYSGRKDTVSNNAFVKCAYKCERCEIDTTNPNCLYMGDFEKNSISDMKTFYNQLNLWTNIQSIQVPHHGSRHNYSPDLYDCATCGFMSCGTTNTFHHPGQETLMGMVGNGCQPLITTEEPKSKIRFHYVE
ncbi:MAG: MBL fold metallo-hydrolase [Bacteroidales bacterium]|nr:MBL fold metallo-hydrolase [Bacteroidales bacterium]